MIHLRAGSASGPRCRSGWGGIVLSIVEGKKIMNNRRRSRSYNRSCRGGEGGRGGGGPDPDRAIARLVEIVQQAWTDTGSMDRRTARVKYIVSDAPLILANPANFQTLRKHFPALVAILEGTRPTNKRSSKIRYPPRSVEEISRFARLGSIFTMIFSGSWRQDERTDSDMVGTWFRILSFIPPRRGSARRRAPGGRSLQGDAYHRWR